MNVVVKILGSVITLCFAIIGGVWSAYAVLNATMDTKVDTGKKEVLTIVYQLKEERNALIRASDDKSAAQIAALRDDVGEVRKDVRSLLGLARRQAIWVDKTGKSMYTNNGNPQEGNRL